jgi:hypothetical protein
MMLASTDGVIIEARTSATVVFPKPSGITDCFDVEDDQAKTLVGEPACERYEVLSASFLAGLP